jgi:hypothetical protein
MTPLKPKLPFDLGQALSGQNAGLAALALVIYFLLQFLGGLQDFAGKQLSREDRLLAEEQRQTDKIGTLDGRIAALTTQVVEALRESASNCANHQRRGMPLANEGLPTITPKPAPSVRP